MTDLQKLEAAIVLEIATAGLHSYGVDTAFAYSEAAIIVRRHFAASKSSVPVERLQAIMDDRHWCDVERMKAIRKLIEEARK
jgi:hypothetical protein